MNFQKITKTLHSNYTESKGNKAVVKDMFLAYSKI